MYLNINIAKFTLFLLLLIVLAEGVYLISSQRLSLDLLNSTDKHRACERFQDPGYKQKCWEDLIELVLKHEGINQAFEAVQKLYITEPVFASSCHGYVHAIGEKAYKLFSSHQSLTLSSKTSYCGYGFYHAFMESLLLDGSDLNKARQFCDYVDRQMGDAIADAKGACYHGIGHGTADNHDQKYWEDERALIDPALKLCEKVAPNEVLLNRCSSGVFNVLAIAYNGKKVRINPQDPLWFCRQLSNNIYRKTCYEEMNTALLALTHGDLIQAAKFIEEINEDDFASSGMRSLAGVLGISFALKSDFTKPIYDCGKVQKRLRFSCIKGFVAGLIEGGSPNQEYTKALQFCADERLSQVEKTACYQEVFWLSSQYYPKQKFQQICKSVDEEYRQFCNL